MDITQMEETDKWGTSVNALVRRMQYAWRGADGFDPDRFREDLVYLTGLYHSCEAIRSPTAGGCDVLAPLGREVLDRCKERLGFWGLTVGWMVRSRRCTAAKARVVAPLAGADVDGLISACEGAVKGVAACADDEVCRDRVSAILAAMEPPTSGEDVEEAAYRAAARGRPVQCKEVLEAAYDARMAPHFGGVTQ